MKKFKKLLAIIMATTMTVTAMATGTGANSNFDNAKSANVTYTIDDLESFDDAIFFDDICETGEALFYNETTSSKSSNSTRGGAFIRDVNYINEMASLAPGDMDFLIFVAPTARTVAAMFTAAHADMIALLAYYDVSTGIATPTGVVLYPGDSISFYLPAGVWCWVIINNGSISGWYNFIANGYNPSGLTNIEATPDLSIVGGWLNGNYYINGIITSTNPPPTGNQFNQGEETLILRPGQASVQSTAMINATQVRYRGQVYSSSNSYVDFLIRYRVGNNFVTDSISLMNRAPGTNINYWLETVPQSSTLSWQFIMAPYGNSTNGNATGTIQW